MKLVDVAVLAVQILLALSLSLKSEPCPPPTVVSSHEDSSKQLWVGGLRICERCGKEFQQKFKLGLTPRFCSTDCHDPSNPEHFCKCGCGLPLTTALARKIGFVAWHKNPPPPPIEIVCASCGNIFSKSALLKKPQKFCSASCRKRDFMGRHRAKPPETPPCKCGCGNLCVTYDSRQTGYFAYHDVESLHVVRSASAKKAIKKTRRVLMAKYGVSNPSQVPGAMAKREATWMRTKGVRNILTLKPYEPSSLEISMEAALSREGIDFQRQPIICGWAWDFLVGRNLIVECDGDYWHRIPRAARLDKRKDAEALKAGYVVVRFWESELIDDIGRCVTVIKNALLKA